MTTAILYYSLSGNTRKYAQQLAAETQADLFEIKEKRPRNLFTSFLPGCPQAMRQAKPAIQPIDCDLTAYNTFVLAAPVWADFPAPAFNSALALLPMGANVRVILTSGSGKSERGKDKVKALIAAQGCQLESYTDIQVPRK